MELGLKEYKKLIDEENRELEGLAKLIGFHSVGQLFFPGIKGQIEDWYARMEFRLKVLMSEYELKGIAIRKEIFNEVIKILKSNKGLK